VMAAGLKRDVGGGAARLSPAMRSACTSACGSPAR
jgi:hypothetical protein